MVRYSKEEALSKVDRDKKIRKTKEAIEFVHWNCKTNIATNKIKNKELWYWHCENCGISIELSYED